MSSDAQNNNKNSEINPTGIGKSMDKSRTPTKTYETFNTSPPPSANILPEGSGQNTAGAVGRHEVPSLFEAIRTVRLQDFQQVHMYPCAKDGLLVGIASAFGIGGIRAVFGAPIPKAANWAVGSFAVAAIASYELCQAKRSYEKSQIKKIVEVMDKKKEEKSAKQAALEAKRLERRKLKELEDEKKEKSRNWGNWKLW
ncbi:Cytochrome c oxidase assembly protein cox20, mitochondrial [Golovinomyces cichoracearum]|uniref:Cytochrome c oxidase assembly protein COX20, mitochondrial n=1 Tax=Golovinomyces cichoracearum TaxID=62708 RepID=A0A420J0G9_9PEZI|nr:Cytochrome c oxidase assembly protein cox20, mitochondrial [Golovinomyces cichoracearum]